MHLYIHNIHYTELHLSSLSLSHHFNLYQDYISGIHNNMGRTPCCDKNGIKKGPWTPEEDKKLIDYIQKNGYGNWRTLPKNAELQRCGKSCRLRWTNYLKPDIKRGRFSFEEEETIIQLHSILGNKWSTIAARLPGRTDNEVKNYWNTHVRKRLLKMGIDPVTHSPRLDLLDLSSILNSSLYNPSQMNLSRLLGVQTLVNPEILRLATSLLSSRRENPNFLLQNDQENHLCNPHEVQSQLPQLVQSNQLGTQIQEIPICTTLSAPNCIPFPSETQLLEPNVDQFSPDFTNFSSQSCHFNEWQNNGMPPNSTQDYAQVPNFACYGSDQSLFDHPPPSESFNFACNLSTLSTTPSPSPTPLNSNSGYINSSSTTTTTLEDERESYCSMLKFEIPDVFGVNDFL